MHISLHKKLDEACNIMAILTEETSWKNCHINPEFVCKKIWNLNIIYKIYYIYIRMSPFPYILADTYTYNTYNDVNSVTVQIINNGFFSCVKKCWPFVSPNVLPRMFTNGYLLTDIY